jgi:hypothetical protein
MLKKTINDYNTKDILDGNEYLLIDDNGTYKKTSIKNTSSFINQIILKNGNITPQDINKFVVCYTDNESLKSFLDGGGDFNDYTGPLNEVRLPELESFSGQSGLYDIIFNTEYLNLYQQNDQILFVSTDFYINDEWQYESFDMRLRNFNFKLDDPFFESVISFPGFNYELLNDDIYKPADNFSYSLLMVHYHSNGYPSSDYDGSSFLISFSNSSLFRANVLMFIDGGIIKMLVPQTVISYFYFQGNDRFLSGDTYVRFIETITNQRLIRPLGPKLRRKIIGIVDGIYENDMVKVISLPETYQTIPYNSFGSSDYIVNLNINTTDETGRWWSSAFIPFIGGLLYSVEYVTDEYGYYSNDELLLSTTQRYIPITTNKISNPIIFVKDDYGDD